MNALVGAFNQDKALVGAFFVIVQPVVEPMDRVAALIIILVPHLQLPHQRLLGVHEGGGVLLYLISLPILQTVLDM